VYEAAKWAPLFAVEDVCARRLSAFVRGCNARSHARSLRLGSHKRALENAGKQLQKNWYDHAARLQLRILSPKKYGAIFDAEEHAARIVYFAWVRNGKSRSSNRRAEGLLAERQQTEHMAACIIQRALRAYWMLLALLGHAQKVESEASASVLMQSVARGRTSRAEAARRRGSRLAKQAERKEQYKSSTKLQACWRGHRSRLDFLALHAAAEKIQVVLRGRVGRRLVAARRRKFATCVQSFFCMIHARHRVLGMLSSHAPAASSTVDTIAALAGIQAHRAEQRLQHHDKSWQAVAVAQAEYVYALAAEDLVQNVPSHEFGKLMFCDMLIVDGIPVGQSGAHLLATVLARNKTLEAVLITNSDIGQPGLLSLAQSLRSNTTLRTLALGRNSIGKDSPGCPAIATLAEVLRVRNLRLQRLIVEDAGLSDSGAAMLAQSVGDFFSGTYCCLTCLCLNRCNIGEAGGSALGKALATNRTLGVLQLAGNRLRDVAAAEFATALIRNDELHELDLGDNCIGSVGGELLANALGGAADPRGRTRMNTTLRAINLQNNLMTESAWYAFERALSCNSELQSLVVAGNLMPRDTHEHAACVIHARLRSLRSQHIGGLPGAVAKAPSPAMESKTLRQPPTPSVSDVAPVWSLKAPPSRKLPSLLHTPVTWNQPGHAAHQGQLR
jgi:hypothetical protein